MFKFISQNDLESGTEDLAKAENMLQLEIAHQLSELVEQNKRIAEALEAISQGKEIRSRVEFNPSGIMK
jgi:hypothetical protein